MSKPVKQILPRKKVKHQGKTSKAELIRKFFRENPPLHKGDIKRFCQNHPGFTCNYVYKIRSKERNKSKIKPLGSMGSKGVSGKVVGVYENDVLREWVEKLHAPIVNFHSGMKQIGFKKNGDPCSCQIHKGGSIMVYARYLGWEEWLIEKFVEGRWDYEQAKLVVDSCHYTIHIFEPGVKVPQGFLPKDLRIYADWGITVIKDDSPMKNTLHMKISIPKMDRYFGLPEIRKKLDLLIKEVKGLQVSGMRFRYDTKVRKDFDRGVRIGGHVV